MSSFRASRTQRTENARDAEVLGEAFIRAVYAAAHDGIAITHVFGERMRDVDPVVRGALHRADERLAQHFGVARVLGPLRA